MLLRTRAGWQKFAFYVTGVLVFVAAVQLDLVEWLTDSIGHYEHHRVDELMMALALLGLISIGYCILRAMDLRSERRSRKVAESRAEWMAHHDPLTGLGNREALAHALEAISLDSPSARLGVIMIDLDGLKRLNDLFGHAVGDRVLKEVAARLGHFVPEERAFRFGGDEFAVIVRDTQSAGVIAEAMLGRVSEPFVHNGITLDIGACAGIAFHPANSETVAQCLVNADTAMHAAKAAGRGTVCLYDQSMYERSRSRANAERELREAVLNRRITPYYQPIIDLQTGSITAFEALARWERAPGEFVPPTEFIKIAEETGLINQLTEQLLHKASADAVHWPPGIMLSFNISATQLHDRTLGLKILKTLLQTGLSASRLEVEITETAFATDLETASLIVTDLHGGGIKVVLDDFGTGYSSLAHLSNLPFDKIKIDRSFVSSFEDHAKQEKIVKAIFRLCEGLEIATTAEGIETKAQLAALMQMGCTYGQGYLFGKAIPAEMAAVLARENNLMAVA